MLKTVLFHSWFLTSLPTDFCNLACFEMSLFNNKLVTDWCAWLIHWSCIVHTLRAFHVHEVGRRSVYDLLQDDSEAVDVSFLSPVERSNLHT